MKAFIFFLSIVLALNVDAQSYFETKPLNEHLAIVNAHWKKVEFDSEPIAFASDDERIQRHLLEVYKTLSTNQPATLTYEQIQLRKKHLEVLNDYALSGEFPRNTGHILRTPYFVDNYNTPCAVANLLVHDDQTELVNALKASYNFNYLRDMPQQPIEQWAMHNGFEVWELAWIQPAYPYYPETRFLPSNEQFNGVVNHIEYSADEGLTCYAGNFDSLNVKSFYCKNQNGEELSFNSLPNGQSFDFEFLGQGKFAIAGAYATSIDSVGVGMLDETGLNFIPLANAQSYSSHAVEKIGNEIYFDAYFKSLGVSHVYKMNENGLDVTYILELDGIVNDIVGFDNGVAIAGEFLEVLYAFDTIACSNFALIKDSTLSDLDCPMASMANRIRAMEGELYLLGNCPSTPENDSECAFTFSSLNGWQGLLDSASVKALNIAMYQGDVRLFDVINYRDTLLLAGNLLFPSDGMYYNHSRSLIRFDEQGTIGEYAHFNKSVRSLALNSLGTLEVGGSFTSYTYQDPNATSWIQYSTVPMPYAAEIAYHLTNIDEVESTTFSLYPNPSSGVLNLDVESAIKDLRIYDIQGKLVMHKEDLVGNQLSLNLEELTGGVYLLEANLSDSQIIRKEFILR